MSSPFHSAFRLEVTMLEDRSLPDARTNSALLLVLEQASIYAKNQLPPATQSPAAPGSAAALSQSAKEVIANGGAFAATLGNQVVNAGAALKIPAFEAAYRSLNAPKTAAAFSKLATDTVKFKEAPSFVKGAVVAADFLFILEQPVVDFTVNMFAVLDDGAEFASSVKRFAQAAAAYSNPGSMKNINDLGTLAQSEIKNRTDTMFEWGSRVEDAWKNALTQSENADQNAIDNLRKIPRTAANSAQLDAVENELLANSRAVEQSMYKELQAGNTEFAASKKALDRIGAEATTESIVDYNNEIKAIDAFEARLSPQQRQQLAAQIQKYEFQLRDGAVVQLSKFRDYLGSEEVANVNFLSKLHSLTRPLIGRADANQAALEALKNSPVTPGGNNGGGSGGTVGWSQCLGQWKDSLEGVLEGFPHTFFVNVTANGGSIARTGSFTNVLGGSGNFTINTKSGTQFTATATGNFRSPNGQALSQFTFLFVCRGDGTAFLRVLSYGNGDTTVTITELVR